LQKEHELPIIGVIRPGAQAAVESTKNKKVGVVGTPRTIASQMYTTEINKAGSGIQVYPQACPLFVPLAEEGWEAKEATRAVADEYLDGLKQEGIDTLVLGCTHYPILKEMIGKVMGDKVTLVDSAVATARAVRALLEEKELLKNGGGPGDLQVFISDVPYQFKAIGERFLGRELKDITRVDLEAIDLGGYE
jgi:glutamate racemase